VVGAIVVAVIVLVIGTYLADLPKLRKIIGWLLILCSVAVLAAIVTVSAYIIIWRMDLWHSAVRVQWLPQETQQFRP
jgi:hypothetical protein